MVQIPPAQSICTVVVVVDAPPEVMPDLAAHATLGLERFPECDGFVGGALHTSAGGDRLIQYLQWESEDAYVACRDDPRWDDLPSTATFMGHVRAGRARVDARVYEVVTASRS